MKKTIFAKLISTAAVLSLSLGLAGPARAQSTTPPASIVPAGTVIDNDVFLTGPNVVLDGTVNGNVIILGDQVTVNGTVNGTLVAIGQNAVVTGKISGSGYVVALTLETGPASAVARDLYYVGISLATASGASVERDLVAAGLDAGLAGHVGRNLRTVIGPIQLYNGLMDLLGLENLALRRIHFELPPPATATPTARPSSTPQPPTATAAPTETPGSSSGSLDLVAAKSAGSFQVTSTPVPASTPATAGTTAASAPVGWQDWALPAARDWAVLFVLGLLALWLLRDPVERAGAQLRRNPLQSLGSGLVVLVVGLLLFAVALLIAVLIFVTGLALSFVGLWPVTIIFWIVGYAVLSLLVAALWLFIAYGSKILVVYLAADWLFGRAFPSARLRVLSLFVGTLVYALLYSIPMIGWVIGVLVTATGMGAAWQAWRERENPRALPAPEPAPAAPALPPAPLVEVAAPAVVAQPDAVVIETSPAKKKRRA